MQAYQKTNSLFDTQLNQIPLTTTDITSYSRNFDQDKVSTQSRSMHSSSIMNNRTSNRINIRKPDRPPPPPPLPPKPISPAMSSTSLPREVSGYFVTSPRSDYAGSTCSVPVRCKNSCGCERQHCHTRYTPSDDTQSCRSSYYEPPRCCCCHISRCSSDYRHIHMWNDETHSQSSFSAYYSIVSSSSNRSPSHSIRSLNNYTEHFKNIDNCNQHHSQQSNQPNAICYPSARHNEPPNNSHPPIPKERIQRPMISVSPLPELKRPQRPPKPYRSSHYIRHIEQHLERLTQYLSDRNERLKRCESACDESPENATTYLKILANRETRYLRSLRSPISKEDFQEIKKLGAGYQGEVWLVRKITGRSSLFAMKKLAKCQVFDQNHQKYVMAERDILAEADNEWIVQLYYSFQDRTHLYFILEYLPGGDMMNLLINQMVFPEEWARFYIAEIAVALQYVHDMGFIHRDIKPDNILIDAGGHIKLTDFGLCTGFRFSHDKSYYRDDTLNNTTLQQNENNNNADEYPTITSNLMKRNQEYSNKRRSDSLVGSPNYIAPEVLRNNCPDFVVDLEFTDNKLCDWWSVGVILYEMVLGFCPFIDLEALRSNRKPDDQPITIQRRILKWRDHLIFPDSPRCPSLRQDKNGQVHPLSPWAKDLMQRFLCDPKDRICQKGISDIMNHPFFGGIDWANIRSSKPPHKPELTDELDTRHFDSYLINQEPPHKSANHSGSIMGDITGWTHKGFWQPSNSFK